MTLNFTMSLLVQERYPCWAACVVKPTRGVSKLGLFRSPPAAVLGVLWAPCWGRLGVLLAVFGDHSWSLEVPTGLSVGSFGFPFGAFLVSGCCFGGLWLPEAGLVGLLGPSVGPWSVLWPQLARFRIVFFG